MRTLAALLLSAFALGCEPTSQPTPATKVTPAPEAVREESAAEPDVTLAIPGRDEEGFSMFLNPHDQVVTPVIRDTGEWEPTEAHWVARSLREGDVFVDVGANVGYYTLMAARLVGESGRVYAFEPDPQTFALLERNVRWNGFTNVVLEPKAVSSEAGTLRLYQAEKNKGDHRIFEMDGEQRAFVDVESVALDDYFAGRHASPDFVKIDTQGAEMAILQGMTGILEATPDLVMAVEYWPRGLHSFGVEPGDLLTLLESNGFRFFDLNMPLTRPIPEVDRALLDQAYKIRNRRFTNLLTVKAEAAELGPGDPDFPRPR